MVRVLNKRIIHELKSFNTAKFLRRHVYRGFKKGVTSFERLTEVSKMFMSGSKRMPTCSSSHTELANCIDNPSRHYFLPCVIDTPSKHVRRKSPHIKNESFVLNFSVAAG